MTEEQEIQARIDAWKENHYLIAQDPDMKAYVEKVEADIRKYWKWRLK